MGAHAADEDDYAAHVDYIHYNPVKHRHVDRVRDWPHSSFHRYVREQQLPPDWAEPKRRREPMGWLILGQGMAPRQIVGAMIVVGAVILIGMKRH